MEGVSKELLDVIYGLLPGFVACWVFYGLTAHPKSSTFERVVQALIFTIFVKVMVECLEELCTWFGSHFYSFGPWTTSRGEAVSVLIALLLGLILSRFANNGMIHKWLGEWKWYDKIRSRAKWLPTWQWTDRTSMPSEWYSAFHRFKGKVVLHLTGDRRLHGAIDEWSDSPEKGHIIVWDACWLLQDGKMAPLFTVERIIVPTKDVEMVEFLKENSDINVDTKALKDVESMLIEVRKNRSTSDEHKDSPGTETVARREELHGDAGDAT